MPAMGPLPQKTGLVIHLGDPGHHGGESLQAGKEKQLAGQRGRPRALAQGRAARGRAVPQTQGLAESRDGGHSPGTGELLPRRGAICLASTGNAGLSQSP